MINRFVDSARFLVKHAERILISLASFTLTPHDENITIISLSDLALNGQKRHGVMDYLFLNSVEKIRPLMTKFVVKAILIRRVFH